MVNYTLSILVAATLHALDITAGTDSSGKPVQPSSELVGVLLVYVVPDVQMMLKLKAAISMPREVPCGLTPRSQTMANLICDTGSEIETMAI